LTCQSKIYEKKEYEEKIKDKELSDSQRQKFLTKYGKVWICEFCAHHNNIDKKFNPPALENPCYMLKKSNKKKKENTDMEI
jgi:hypothetical protein